MFVGRRCFDPISCANELSIAHNIVASPPAKRPLPRPRLDAHAPLAFGSTHIVPSKISEHICLWSPIYPKMTLAREVQAIRVLYGRSGSSILHRGIGQLRSLDTPCFVKRARFLLSRLACDRRYRQYQIDDVRGLKCVRGAWLMIMTSTGACCVGYDDGGIA